MKIVHLVADYGRTSETFIRDLSEGFARSNLLAAVVCNHCHLDYMHREHSFRIIIKPFLHRSRLIDRVVHYFNSADNHDRGISFAQSQKIAKRELKHILEELAPDLVYIDYGTVAAIVYPLLRELNIPYVVHFHGADITSSLHDAEYRKELIEVFTGTKAIVCASHHIRRLLVLEGADNDRIHTIEHGINLENITPLAWSERENNTPSIVFLGRFTPKKHPVALVEAFRLVHEEIPEARLTMIGDGPELQRVKERISKYKLDKYISLPGALERPEALSIVNQHWVYAQHSVTSIRGDQEGFGISLAEAAALGLPVVSTWHNGIPEQVIDGETGYLVNEHDFESMAKKLIELLCDPEICQKMGNAGSVRVAEKYQIDRRINQLSVLASNS